MPAPALITADELIDIGLPGQRTELIRGQLVVREPSGFAHGEVEARLGSLIAAFVYPRDLGHVASGDPGFKLESNPDTVRAPDVAFVRKDRLGKTTPMGFPALAPDLAVEVVSPNDSRTAVREKAAAWITAGSLLVWVVDPIERNARVYRADGTNALVTAHEVLDGEGVLPGFRCTVQSVLPDA
jgi:Uma2 family endonuclease